MHPSIQTDMVITKTKLSMGMVLSAMFMEEFEAANLNVKFHKCGKVHPMWNGMFTFSFITPIGAERIDYNETLALYRSFDEAEGMMVNTVNNLNNRY